MSNNPDIIRDSAYISAILANFAPPGDEGKVDGILTKDGKPAVSKTHVKYPEDHFRVKITMPDGSEKFFKQIAVRVDDETGFKATAFQEVTDYTANAEPVVNKDGSPVIHMSFGGNSFSAQDGAQIGYFIRTGKYDPKLYEETDQFVADVIKLYEDKGLKPEVIVSGHSAGAGLAMSAAYTLQNEYGINSNSIGLESLGESAFIADVAKYQSGKSENAIYYDHIINLEHFIGDQLIKNHISVHCEDPTAFGISDIGKSEFGNDYIGRQFTFVNNLGASGLVNSHLAKNIATVIGNIGLKEVNSINLEYEELVRNLGTSGRPTDRSDEIQNIFIGIMDYASSRVEAEFGFFKGLVQDVDEIGSPVLGGNGALKEVTSARPPGK